MITFWILLVMSNIAIENGHRNSEFPMKMVIFHSYGTVYQRVIQMFQTTNQ